MLVLLDYLRGVELIGEFLEGASARFGHGKEPIERERLHPADYVLTRKTLQIVDSGVFWPLRADPLSRLTGEFNFALWGLVGGFATSDHRSVWVDVTVPTVH